LIISAPGLLFKKNSIMMHGNMIVKLTEFYLIGLFE